MQIQGRTAFVTDADRGPRIHFVGGTSQHGSEIHGPVSHPDAVQLEGVTPIAVDIADDAPVPAAAETTSDVRGV
jgi:hypothetical protein